MPMNEAGKTTNLLFLSLLKEKYKSAVFGLIVKERAKELLPYLGNSRAPGTHTDAAIPGPSPQSKASVNGMI